MTVYKRNALHVKNKLKDNQSVL